VYLLVTGFRHEPYLIQLLGAPGDPAGWLAWSEPWRLEILVEGLNADHLANAAYLVDWRGHDGYFYLFYAGRTEGHSHAGRGDNRLGVARSRDLVRWQVPGDGRSRAWDCRSAEGGAGNGRLNTSHLGNGRLSTWPMRGE